MCGLSWLLIHKVIHHLRNIQLRLRSSKLHHWNLGLRRVRALCHGLRRFNHGFIWHFNGVSNACQCIKKKSLELLTEMIISLLDATSSLASINKIESLGEAHNFLNGLYYYLLTLEWCCQIFSFFCWHLFEKLIISLMGSFIVC